MLTDFRQQQKTAKKQEKVQLSWKQSTSSSTSTSTSTSVVVVVAVLVMMMMIAESKKLLLMEAVSFQKHCFSTQRQVCVKKLKDTLNKIKRKNLKSLKCSENNNIFI